MCVLLFPSFIWLHVYAFAIKSKVHCKSAFEPRASGLPYYCTPPVCVPDEIGALTLWRQKTTKKKEKKKKKGNEKKRQQNTYNNN